MINSGENAQKPQKIYNKLLNSEKIPRNLATLLVLKCSKCHHLIPRPPKNEQRNMNPGPEVQIMINWWEYALKTQKIFKSAKFRENAA